MPRAKPDGKAVIVHRIELGTKERTQLDRWITWSTLDDLVKGVGMVTLGAGTLFGGWAAYQWASGEWRSILETFSDAAVAGGSALNMDVLEDDKLKAMPPGIFKGLLIRARLFRDVFFK